MQLGNSSQLVWLSGLIGVAALVAALTAVALTSGGSDTASAAPKFWNGETYVVTATGIFGRTSAGVDCETQGANQVCGASSLEFTPCDAGDVVLTAVGRFGATPGPTTATLHGSSIVDVPRQFLISWQNGSTPEQILLSAYCADFDPAH